MERAERFIVRFNEALFYEWMRSLSQSHNRRRACGSERAALYHQHQPSGEDNAPLWLMWSRLTDHQIQCLGGGDTANVHPRGGRALEFTARDARREGSDAALPSL